LNGQIITEGKKIERDGRRETKVVLRCKSHQSIFVVKWYFRVIKKEVMIFMRKEEVE